MTALLERDYVELKIDTERHLNGEKVAKELRGERTGGIPWIVITDASGSELVSSDGPSGNIGCPVQPHETEWFLTMLDRTRRNLNDDQLAVLEAALEDFAKAYRR